MTEQSVRRIASLQPSVTVILDAIGELGRVVACTKYCADVVPAIAKQAPTILSDSWTADASQIIATNPDLVIAAVPYQEKAVVEILKAGVRFLGLAPKSLADIYVDISVIGGVVGAHVRSAEAISAMEQRIDEVRKQASKCERPRVFCEEWGKPIIASQKWVAELVHAAGGTFIGEPGRKLSGDELVTFNADIIIAAWCGAGDRVPLEKIIRDRGWSQTSAARAGRVYCIADEFLNTPAPTLMQGLDALAFAIHPELFPRTKGIREITGVSASRVEDYAH
jgi:iron complex transport system substrate-binding protein